MSWSLKVEEREYAEAKAKGESTGGGALGCNNAEGSVMVLERRPVAALVNDDAIVRDDDGRIDGTCQLF